MLAQRGLNEVDEARGLLLRHLPNMKEKIEGKLLGDSGGTGPGRGGGPPQLPPVGFYCGGFFPTLAVARMILQGGFMRRSLAHTCTRLSLASGALPERDTSRKLPRATGLAMRARGPCNASLLGRRRTVCLTGQM